MLRCRSPLLALSCPNLPCALKAAIGFGKRTLGDPASLPRRGAAARPITVREPTHGQNRGAPIASMAARTRRWRRSGRCGNGAWDPSLQRPAFGVGQGGRPARTSGRLSRRLRFASCAARPYRPAPRPTTWVLGRGAAHASGRMVPDVIAGCELERVRAVVWVSEVEPFCEHNLIRAVPGLLIACQSEAVRRFRADAD